MTDIDANKLTIAEIAEGEYRFVGSTPIAGWYRLGHETIYCTKFSMHKKPSFIHRFFMRVMLGWYWEDNLK